MDGWKAARLVFGLLLMFAFAGCGSGGDSSTNGHLTLTATGGTATGGVVSVLATAAYTNSTATSFVNVPIKITASVHTLNGTPQVFVNDLNTDDTGTVTRTYTIQQTTETIFVNVTASTGGLSQTTTVTVPSL